MNQVRNGRMYLYVWSYKNEPEQCKLGDRFVFDGQDPKVECDKRIRESLGVNKNHFDESQITVHGIYDVSEWAAKTPSPDGGFRNKPHGKMDDYVRNEHIGFRHGKTGDKHDISGEEMVSRLLDLLNKEKQPLPPVGLAIWQHDTLVATQDDIKNSKNTIVIEACARFGKTIFTGTLAREQGTQLTIIASYVLTCFRSFSNDLRSFAQFRDMVIVDTKSSSYQSQIAQALLQRKQVVAFISMVNGGNRASRISYLFGLKASRMLVIDEADYGSHQAAQAEALINHRKPNDVVVLMTGTNADKAAALWPSVAYHSVTYPELLVIKKTGAYSYKSQLQHFAVDPHRHQLVADVEFYQADLSAVVNLAIKAEPDMFRDSTDCLPSYPKASKDVNKAAGFWSRMFEAVFQGKHGVDELNMASQLNLKDDRRVVMMFVPGSMKNEEFAKLLRIARDSLGTGFDIEPVYGESTNNRQAEQKVLEAVVKAKKTGRSLLILSKGMAQRSFSIPEITELYLAYDSGDTGATIQRLSRALTPAANKTAKVVSLSFNPNRDDKFDAVLMQTANNLKAKTGQTLPQALRDVLSSFDLYRCTGKGRVQVNADTYTKQLLENDRLARLIATKADIRSLTADEINAIASGNADAFKKAAAAKAKTGKTHVDKLGRVVKLATKNQIAKAREVMATIVANLHIMIHATGAQSIDEMLAAMDANVDYQERVTEIFGVDYALIKALFDRGVMPRDLLELTLTV